MDRSERGAHRPVTRLEANAPRQTTAPFRRVSASCMKPSKDHVSEPSGPRSQHQTNTRAKPGRCGWAIKKCLRSRNVNSARIKHEHKREKEATRSMQRVRQTVSHIFRLKLVRPRNSGRNEQSLNRWTIDGVRTTISDARQTSVGAQGPNEVQP